MSQIDAVFRLHISHANKHWLPATRGYYRLFTLLCLGSRFALEVRSRVGRRSSSRLLRSRLHGLQRAAVNVALSLSATLIGMLDTLPSLYR